MPGNFTKQSIFLLNGDVIYQASDSSLSQELRVAESSYSLRYFINDLVYLLGKTFRRGLFSNGLCKGLVRFCSDVSYFYDVHGVPLSR